MQVRNTEGKLESHDEMHLLQGLFSTRVIKQSFVQKHTCHRVADVLLMSAGYGYWPPINSCLINIIRCSVRALNANRVLYSKSTCPGISTIQIDNVNHIMVCGLF